MAWLRRSACLFLSGWLFWVPGALARNITTIVASPDETHIAWVSAQHFAALAGKNGLNLKLSRAGNGKPATTSDKSPQLFVQPLHELAREVSALSVLELPFFYPDIAAVHRALAGELAMALRDAGRERGWEILAVWDEGLHVMSGNLAYTHPQRLQGIEFLLLRDDSIAEMEFRALDVWSRRARPASLAQLHKECVVGSRSATLQQLRREQLARVHLDLTLTRHRYESWVIALPSASWKMLAPAERTAIMTTLSEMQAWQRARAQQEEDAALKELTQTGNMTAHPLGSDIWMRYRSMQPEWTSFLSPALSAESRRRLVGLATAAAGIDLGRKEALPQATHQAP